ncbi:MAG TPA: HDOD domain-containing protein [Terriglobales bacterium]|nr:HDOD domain-containing protein [Terriglobales bacterium]
MSLTELENATAERREAMHIASGSDEQRKVLSLAAQYSVCLPTTGSSLFRLNQLLSVTPVDLRAVSDIAHSDPSIAAHVLRLVQSEHSGIGERFRPLDECVVLLGVSIMRSLVFTTALAPTDEYTTARLKALWQHSHLTAVLSRRIAVECGYPEVELAYVSGLLHDIGKVPLILASPQTQCARVPAEGVLRHHPVVGARLSKMWELPSLISDVIEHHHNPAGARHDQLLTSITAAANQICELHGVGLGFAPADTYIANLAEILSRFLPDPFGHMQEIEKRLRYDLSRWFAALRTSEANCSRQRVQHMD